MSGFLPLQEWGGSQGLRVWADLFLRGEVSQVVEEEPWREDPQECLITVMLPSF